MLESTSGFKGKRSLSFLFRGVNDPDKCQWLHEDTSVLAVEIEFPPWAQYFWPNIFQTTRVTREFDAWQNSFKFHRTEDRLAVTIRMLLIGINQLFDQKWGRKFALNRTPRVVGLQPCANAPTIRVNAPSSM